MRYASVLSLSGYNCDLLKGHYGIDIKTDIGNAG